MMGSHIMEEIPEEKYPGDMVAASILSIIMNLAEHPQMYANALQHERIYLIWIRGSNITIEQ